MKALHFRIVDQIEAEIDRLGVDTVNDANVRAIEDPIIAWATRSLHVDSGPFAPAANVAEVALIPVLVRAMVEAALRARRHHVARKAAAEVARKALTDHDALSVELGALRAASVGVPDLPAEASAPVAP